MRARLRDPEYVHRIRWIALLVVCLSLTVIGIDNTVLNVALPTLAHPARAGGLNASGSELQWIVDAYIIVFAGLLLTEGSLGDRFGRYRALTVGLVIFGIGSVLSAFAPSATTLIAARAVMGVGGAAIMPATLSIITNVFHSPHERAKAIGIWAGVVAIGIGTGPVIGGFLLEHFWWGSVFLVNVPVVMIALALGFAFVPESRDPSAPRLDPLGSVLSIVGLTTLLWAIIEGPSKGWGSTAIVAAFTIAAVVIVTFGWWELRSSHPMLDLRFFENPRFSAASAAITITFLALVGMVFLLTQYLQSVLGYSTIKAGAVLVPMSAMMMIFAPLSPRWVRKFGNKVVVAAGMVCAAIGLLLMTTFQVGSSTIHVVLVTMVVGFGMAHVMAPATESVMGAVPREKAGVGSAMNDTTRQFGGAVGVALLGSIAASIYSSHMKDALESHVPSAVLRTSRDSVGAALGAASTGPRATAAAIDAAARASFVAGLHAAVVVGAVFIGISVVIVLRWLPAWARIEPDVLAQEPELASGPADLTPAVAAADVVEEWEYEHEPT